MNSFDNLRRQAQRKWELRAARSHPVIYIGTASCGRAAGAMDVLAAVQETLKENSLAAEIVQVGCIGPCYLEPLMDIALPGKPRVSYANVTPDKARIIVKAYLLRGDPLPKTAVGFIGDHDGETFEGIARFFDLPMLKPQVRIVLRNCGFIDPEDIDQYLANDGYVGLQNAFRNGPEGVIAEVKEAGLRGRGGAGFPTFKKWEICRKAPGDAKYMICNADEGDPGAFMNRSLI